MRPFLHPELKRRYAEAFRSDLETARPRFCLVNERELWEFRAEPAVSFLIGLLDRDYRRTRSIGESSLYRLQPR